MEKLEFGQELEFQERHRTRIQENMHVDDLANFEQYEDWVASLDEQNKDKSEEDPGDGQGGSGDFFGKYHGLLADDVGRGFEFLFQSVDCEHVSIGVGD